MLYSTLHYDCTREIFMSAGWDLTTYDRDNKLALVVEVKSKLDATVSWAAQLRRNILAHGTFPNAPYFLMAFPVHILAQPEHPFCSNLNTYSETS